MNNWRGIRAWDDNAGTPAAKVLTTSFVKSDGPVIPAHPRAGILLLTVTLSGTAVGTLHLKVVPSPDRGATERGAIPIVAGGAGGKVIYTDASHEKTSPSTSIKHTFPIQIFPGLDYVVYAKRTGGSTDSAALIIADVIEAIGDGHLANPAPSGQYRSDPAALILGDTDGAPPAVDLQGHLVPRSDWRPIDGGGQRVNIGTAAYSSALTVGAEYLITAKVDCWIASVANNSTPAVAGEDFFLPAYTPFHHVVRTGLTYIAVITDSATLANGLSICRVR
jgi:hypothetical protein